MYKICSLFKETGQRLIEKFHRSSLLLFLLGWLNGRTLGVVLLDKVNY